MSTELKILKLKLNWLNWTIFQVYRVHRSASATLHLFYFLAATTQYFDLKTNLIFNFDRNFEKQHTMLGHFDCYREII